MSGGFLFGQCSDCCRCPYSHTGPWCIKLEWDLSYNDFGQTPPAYGPISGNATLWIEGDDGAAGWPDNDTRTCTDSVATTDPRGTGDAPGVPPALSWGDGAYVFYDAIRSDDYSADCLYIAWQFDDSTNWAGLVSVLLDTDGGLVEGVNNVFAGDIATIHVTGTVTLTITLRVPLIGDCGC